MHFVFTGTESTFKSTVATRIAMHFNLLYIPEFARTYLEEISPNTQIKPIARKDYNLIEEGQLALLSSQGYFDSNQPKVFDTDGTVLHIWKTDKFDVIDHELLNIPSHIIYFLCYPNVEGAYDPLRMDLDRRDVLHEQYVNVLKELPNTTIHLNQETLEERVIFATTQIERLLNDSI